MKPKINTSRAVKGVRWNDVTGEWEVDDGTIKNNPEAEEGSNLGLITTDTNSHLLPEILMELKKNNAYLLCILGGEDKITDEDILNEEL